MFHAGIFLLCVRLGDNCVCACLPAVIPAQINPHPKSVTLRVLLEEFQVASKVVGVVGVVATFVEIFHELSHAGLDPQHFLTHPNPRTRFGANN